MKNNAHNPCKSGVHHRGVPFFLDTRETVQRFGSAVAEFRSLLDRNHVTHGSPNDLFEFTRTLEESNQFRMDLSAMVKSVMSKERDELLLTDMMSIIAASVGGPSVTDTDVDITKPTNTLMEFLLGTGCWNWKQFGVTRSIAQRAAAPSVRMEEPEPIRISLPISRTKPAAEMPEDKASLLEISKELRQTLSRLESNTQQVKQHLESIERRIGKLESAPMSDPVNKLAGLEPLLHRGTTDIPAPKPVAPVVREMPREVPTPIDPPLSTRGRAVFSGPAFHDVSGADDDDDFSSPTFAYGTEKRSNIVPLAIFIILAAIGIAIFFFVHSARGSALLNAELARFKQNHIGSSPTPAPSAPAATPPATPLPATGTSSTTPPPSSDQHNATGANAAVPAPAATTSASEDTSSTASSSEADARSLSSDPKIKYIPANMMEGYLLSAPRPEYPTRARIDHIEGQVVLQAIISRRGSIRALHAIKGPESLRSAAVAAVRTWRYKPYSIDGQAQDIATTIYVDFTLRPPPTLVR